MWQLGERLLDEARLVALDIMTMYEARIQRYTGRCRPSESIMQLRSTMTSSTRGSVLTCGCWGPVPESTK